MARLPTIFNSVPRGSTWITNLRNINKFQGSNPYRNSPTMRSYPAGMLGEPFGPPLTSPKQLSSPQLTSPLALSGSQADIDKLSQDLSAAHVKLASWEQAWTKARQACEAWKKEAEVAENRARKAERERLELSLSLEKVI